MLHLSLDEGKGVVLKDRSSFKNNGTLTGWRSSRRKVTRWPNRAVSMPTPMWVTASAVVVEVVILFSSWLK
jgi:hypothetical protein